MALGLVRNSLFIFLYFDFFFSCVGGAYCAKTKTGGPIDSIMTEEKYNHASINGLKKTMNWCGKFIYLILSGVVAVEVTGGPNINLGSYLMLTFMLGASHLRDIFFLMSLDKDIVGLSEGHTLVNFCGLCFYISSSKVYTGASTSVATGEGTTRKVRELLEGDSEELLQLPTGNVLVEDPVFHPYVELHAKISYRNEENDVT
ncbi:hypothetical protein Cgig2_014744 [Carnegiea gigantea]|uniref:Uncharacterized protein n=1 Tax=Carnegiea gigantea TaxID=171969 RepID=A0A9Q1KY57_9CARY|nr:hypothetical protein Cgig2_014744 [Carnegiea gigantea]